MKSNVLTHLKAKNAPIGKHADGQGLWLVKRERDAGKWVLRVQADGSRREMGLGRWPDVSISEARERASEARKVARDNLDPIDARKKARRVVKRLTLKEAIDGCFDARKAELKGDGEAGRWMSPLSVHVLPKLGREAVEDIDQHMLKDLLAPLWHTKPEAAAKALNRIAITLRHCAALGLDVDLQATMKTRALLGKQRHETIHIPALPYEEAPAFFQKLLTMDLVAARALRLLMLTIARTTEVRLTAFPEFKSDLWTLPAERTKTGVERRIPLVASAVAVLEECRRSAKGDHLFPAHRGQPISDAAMAALMKREEMTARPHGFRATFRTWVEEQTDAPFEVKEACLGHVVDSEVVGAYQRSDRLEKRRALLERWEAHLLS